MLGFSLYTQTCFVEAKEFFYSMHASLVISSLFRSVMIFTAVSKQMKAIFTFALKTVKALPGLDLN